MVARSPWLLCSQYSCTLCWDLVWLPFQKMRFVVGSDTVTGKKKFWCELTLQHAWSYTVVIQGAGGPALPPAPKISSKSCSVQAILRENPLFWANFAPPFGVKTPLGPPDQNPGSAPDTALLYWRNQLENIGIGRGQLYIHEIQTERVPLLKAHRVCECLGSFFGGLTCLVFLAFRRTCCCWFFFGLLLLMLFLHHFLKISPLLLSSISPFLCPSFYLFVYIILFGFSLSVFFSWTLHLSFDSSLHLAVSLSFYCSLSFTTSLLFSSVSPFFPLSPCFCPYVFPPSLSVLLLLSSPPLFSHLLIPFFSLFLFHFLSSPISFFLLSLHSSPSLWLSLFHTTIHQYLSLSWKQINVWSINLLNSHQISFNPLY